MNSITTGVAAALISGVAMYTMGAKTTQLDALTQNAAMAQAANTQFVPASSANALRPVAASRVALTPIRNTRPAPAPQPAVSDTAPIEERDVVPDESTVARDESTVVREDQRSWKKTAMIIGGSAASGAAVGGIAKGKKGALIGAAIGGGAASIYEAIQRR